MKKARANGMQTPKTEEDGKRLILPGLTGFVVASEAVLDSQGMCFSLCL